MEKERKKINHSAPTGELGTVIVYGTKNGKRNSKHILWTRMTQLFSRTKEIFNGIRH